VISHKTPIYKNSFPIGGGTFKNAGRTSSRIKTLLEEMKLPKEVIQRAAVITYEAEINICCYADRGRIMLRVTPKFVTIEAIDEGQGIADIELAMREGYSTATEKIRSMGFGAGMGLANIKKFSDTFRIISEVGRGTHLKMIIVIDRNRDKDSADISQD
jgi:anti-sigma regulatory factor (Ser/Thr protein kinase)